MLSVKVMMMFWGTTYIKRCFAIINWSYLINLLFIHIDLRGDLHDYLRASIYPAMIFLVVSCPCALIISVPLGFFGGIGTASKKGILVKGSNYLENLRNVGIVVFDKTGTLTIGQFSILKIVPISEEIKE